MREKQAQAETSSKPTGGFSLTRSFLSLVKLIVIAGILMVGLIPIIYLHGSHRPHLIDEHPLYQIFEEPAYKEINKELNKKNANRILLHGSFEGGLYHFVTHYANKLTQKDKDVVFYQTGVDDTPIRPYVKQAKHFIQSRIGLQPHVPTLWIIIAEKQLPLLQINLLLARYPKDRILVVTQSGKQSLPSFKKIAYTPVTPKGLQDSMVEGLKMDQSIVDVVYEHFGSVQAIFNLIDDKPDALTPENILGDYLKPMDSLTQSDKAILEMICKNGQGKAEKPSKTLDSFGCIFYQKKYYWNHDLAGLNYELQQQKNCPAKGVMPDKLRKQMAQQLRRQQEQRAIAAQKTEESKDEMQKKQKQGTTKKQAPQPKMTTKKQTPKKEAPKKETPKKEAPVKEAPVKEAPKKEALEKEAPKKETPEKEAPKKETPKKETPKPSKTKANSKK